MLQNLYYLLWSTLKSDKLIFSTCHSWDNSVMVVSLSTNALKLYSPTTGQFLGDCLGHTDTINDVLFPDSRMPQLFCSSSSDGTVRVWDTRTRQQVYYT